MIGRISKGYQKDLAITATAVSLTVPAGSKGAVIRVISEDIIFTEDGSTPTSSNGLPAYSGETVEYLDADYEFVLSKWSAIRMGGVNASVSVAYYR